MAPIQINDTVICSFEENEVHIQTNIKMTKIKEIQSNNI